MSLVLGFLPFRSLRRTIAEANCRQRQFRTFRADRIESHFFLKTSLRHGIAVIALGQPA